MALTKVFEPIRIGNVEVPNRIVRAAHGTAHRDAARRSWAARTSSRTTSRAPRAASGLSILEAIGRPPQLRRRWRVSDDRGDRAATRSSWPRVRPHGMRVFQQLLPRRAHQRRRAGRRRALGRVDGRPSARPGVVGHADARRADRRGRRRPSPPPRGAAARAGWTASSSTPRHGYLLAPVPVAALQHAHRRVRRRPREPHALPRRRSCARCAPAVGRRLRRRRARWAPARCRAASARTSCGTVIEALRARGADRLPR